ncbi:MAG TPA: SPOR domain-containing protein [Candidatus Polarisedimenticolaceae bacterium]|nr:SPOR domain-containing protein [Candidatus Polarisedimenticolaceae bacterium]
MRDTHRMREKYDLSLDSRQVVSLLIGGIVVLGAVFVLGVLVGKKLAGTPRADRAPDLLTALDHKSDALERARAAPPLTFQEELTRPAAPAPTVARAPGLSAPAAPESAPAAAAAHPPPAPAVAASSLTPAPAPASSAGTTTAVATKPALRPAAVPATTAAAETKADRKTEPEKKAEPARPAPPQSVATRSAPAAAHPTPKVPEATSPTGAFTLQLGASPTRDDAERQASRLREKGYAPYIVAAEVPGKGTWYRVRMGSFPNKEAATRYLQDFKRETQAEAFVASTR